MITSTTASLIVFLVGLGLFVYLCFTKINRIWAVVLAIMVFALSTSSGYIDTFFTVLPEGAVSIIKAYLWTTLAGALSGCAIMESGCANRIAETVMKWIGVKRGIWAIFVVCFLVTLSGAPGHMWICLPLVLAICRTCNLSRGIGLMVYVSQVQIVQFGLVGVPGLPNIMPAEILGCTIYEVPLMSVVSCVVAEALCLVTAFIMEKQDKKHNRGFQVVPEVNIYETPPERTDDQMPGFVFSLLPLVFMIGGALFLSSVCGLASTPSAIIPQIFTAFFLFFTCKKYWAVPDAKSKKEADSKRLLQMGEAMIRPAPMMITTGFIGGMGSVIANMYWYNPAMDWALGLNTSPYLLAFLVVALIAFITSDGIAAMNVFLTSMTERFLAIPGINVGALHRVIVSTACTIESMPWTAGCYNYNSYFGMTVKTGWKYHFVGTVGCTLAMALTNVLYASIVYPC